MKVYCANLYSSSEGIRLSWHSSKRAAEAAVREFAKGEGKASYDPTDVEVVIIPTSKAGLLRWLNARFTSDNG